mgnify:CR=1 FL=1
MGVKYVFVTGGVVSGLGKGITAASLGRLLKARGYHVTMQKLDPYINVDPGTMNPIQHGEVFVTDDGTETDLDLGHYERFIDESLDQNSNVTTGKIYWSVLHKERHGDYGGGTVQVIPHITNEIKSKFYREKSPEEDTISIIEVGGTVGDIESQPFLEAIRQFQHEMGRENAILIQVTLIPYLKASGEMKTKPTQMSVKQLQSMGIWPDILVCRTEHELSAEIKNKISYLCNITPGCVIENNDVKTIYEVPLMLEREGLCVKALEKLGLPDRAHDLSDWRDMVQHIISPKREVNVALVGKYIKLHDAYLSVVESLIHAGAYHDARVNIHWVESEEITPETVDQLLDPVDAVLIPGGFGQRGTEGKILAVQYARTHKKPFFGICLGLQMAVIEYARHVAGLEGANSTEMDPHTPYPVIDMMETQIGVTHLGGTQRLGQYTCQLEENSKSMAAYGTPIIHERHRHRYEFNAKYADKLFDGNLHKAGTNPETGLVEIVELVDHPWFVGVQFHPEFLSRPMRPHPLFREFIGAALSEREGGQD